MRDLTALSIACRLLRRTVSAVRYQPSFYQFHVIHHRYVAFVQVRRKYLNYSSRVRWLCGQLEETVS